MKLWLAVAVGGALGAMLRYGVSSVVQRWLGASFPSGTLAVNVLGSLLAGVLYVILTERTATPPALRGLLVVGLLGAFTTFSTFSIETVMLVEAGREWRALVNVFASVLICVGAAWVGVVLGRWA